MPIGTFLLAVNVVIINIAAFVFSLEKAMLPLAVYYKNDYLGFGWI
ncbi:hypothetical protein [Neobacillus sp. PS3-34]